MVDRLAARLKQDGSDVEGWVRLVRAYKVLGELDSAREAIASARQALAGDPGKLNALDVGLKALGLPDAAFGAASPFDSGAMPNATPRPPPEHQHDATMQEMVERLADRLKVSGSDPQGWLMLVRSYLSLGEKDKATAAIGNARQALAADSDKLAQFNEALTVYNIAE
jgi:cytochrome c-type biogenesis protein CcmH/NrfG